MIRHYLKVAWRNLLKYRTQTAINVTGLAVGFACFAFANLWMRYEASFDSRHEGADRMYLLYAETAIEAGGLSPHVPYPVSTLLKQEFPEVEAACAFTRYPNWELELEGQPALEVPSMQLDSCFMNFFGIRVLAGTEDFLYTDGRIALTEQTARKLFGTTDVLGRTVTYNDKEVTVCAIVSDLPHSNFSFGFICEGAYFRKWQDVWYNGGFEVVVRLAPGVSPRALEEKFRAFNLHVISIDGHDFEAICSAFAQARATKGRPTAIIAHTVKGKGISFMENVAGWHGVAPNDEDYERAISELGGK